MGATQVGTIDQKSWFRRKFPITASVTKVTTVISAVAAAGAGLLFATSAVVAGAPILAVAGIGLFAAGITGSQMALGIMLPAFVGSIVVEAGIKAYKESYAAPEARQTISNDNRSEKSVVKEAGDLARSPNSKIAELENVVSEDFEEALSNDNDIEQAKKYEPKPSFAPKGLGM